MGSSDDRRFGARSESEFTPQSLPLALRGTRAP
jgi:hypothetical protein